MIARLTGVIDSVGEDWTVLDVGGVGYLVYCSGRTLRAIGGRGAQASLSIETHVREDHIHLYGFADADERDWFRLLTTVQGVGARVAVAILSALSPDQLTGAVAAQDKAALTAAQGVGAKLGARIVSELRDKVDALAMLRRADSPSAARAGDGDTGTVPDAVSALVNLGYRRTEAFGAVSHAARLLGDAATVESLITAGLKELGA
ncbi:MAG: Holliday junction branch migration protein RuvA [Alphaproteobacteria bacterium]|nr:Holliday junction branch migration protein RuvA [Alphaproteobacteria bacterium]